MLHTSYGSRRGFGFTVIELLTCLLIVGALAAFTAGAVATANEHDQTIQCAKNLQIIGQSLLAYTETSRGPYPRGRYDYEKADTPTVYTGATVASPFAKDGPVNDVTVELYLILREQDMSPSVMICPASGKKPMTKAEVKKHWNFPDNASLSYSIADAYPDTNAQGSGFKMVVGLDPTFAVAADMNSGDPVLLKLKSNSPAAELAKGNSKNHDRKYQNVLYGDGHVENQTTPFCGTDGDNIYTYGASGKKSGGKGFMGSPDGAADSVLLPIDKDGTPKRNLMMRSTLTS